MKTSNLFSLRKYLFKRGKGGFSGIRPKTPFCFAGTSFTYSADFIGDGNGTITKEHWSVISPSGDIIYSSDGPALTWVITTGHDEIEVEMVVTYTSPNGATYTETYVDNVIPQIFEFNIRLDLVYPNFFLSDTASEAIPISTTRQIMDLGSSGYYFRDLVEGESIPFPSNGENPGRLTVVRSRTKIVAGNAKPEIDVPTASQAKLLFKKYGYVEYVNDVSLTYDYQDQHYSKDLPASYSALYGIYPYNVSVKFEKNPSGIILGSSCTQHLNNFRRCLVSLTIVF
ncbi:MAG: hypothetical protein HQM09_16010 [Candidatus Riflebacteria bacterium]|nr:hypothetical protein [Candidatus Riflebacteria bacterium]